jgi:hypothetical protein
MPFHDEIGDARFRAQFRLMRDAFRSRERAVEIQVEPFSEKDVDFIYAVDRILVRDADVDRVLRDDRLPRLERAEEQPGRGITVLLSRDEPVPQVLDRIDAVLDEPGVATPDHVLFVCPVLCCPAVEPDVPGCCGEGAVPCPPPAEQGGKGILVGVSDTGLLPGAAHPWLAGVTGAPDVLPPLTSSGVQPIPAYAGHGTFVAGMVRTTAPASDVTVADHFPTAGAAALLESEIVDRLVELLDRGVRVINLSAGTTTRRNRPALSFEVFWDDHLSKRPEVVFVAAAGNLSSSREFWPAAFPWAVSVGALAADLAHRAWFSNRSNPRNDWVDLYAAGEHLVNAYATGDYTYTEPPRRGAVSSFREMARWSGTSFSAPLVAGAVATWLEHNPSADRDAARAALMATATADAVPGVGPALLPGRTI